MEAHIWIIVGMSGSGKSTAVDYLTRQGVPKVGPEQIATEEIERLVSAGQRQIVLDGVYNWETYREIKQKYAGKTTTIALVAPKSQRLHRVAGRTENPLTTEELQRRDYDDATELGLGNVLAVADFYIMNDGPMKHICEQLDAIINTV